MTIIDIDWPEVTGDDRAAAATAPPVPVRPAVPQAAVGPTVDPAGVGATTVAARPTAVDAVSPTAGPTVDPAGVGATAVASTTPVPTVAGHAVTRRPPRRLFADLAGPLGRGWVIALAVAWVVVVGVGLAVEPAPADPDAAIPLIATVLSTGLLSAWGAMAAGMFQRRRFAAAASLVAGAGLLALTVGCPASGHHGGIGAWWGVQVVGALCLLALSRRALRSS